MARVHVLKETTIDPPGDWQLWFQWCRYDLDDRTQFGYRFIWRWPHGALQAARGQARLPTIAQAKALMDKATDERWGDRNGDEMEAAALRLERQGCVVTLSSGYVGWPDKDAAAKGILTDEMLGDERIIRAWS